ncbi:unnamed protein product, partial [Adineta steineri]
SRTGHERFSFDNACRKQVGENLTLVLYQHILTQSSAINLSQPLVFCQLNESYCKPLATMDKVSYNEQKSIVDLH